MRRRTSPRSANSPSFPQGGDDVQGGDRAQAATGRSRPRLPPCGPQHWRALILMLLPCGRRRTEKHRTLRGAGGGGSSAQERKGKGRAGRRDGACGGHSRRAATATMHSLKFSGARHRSARAQGDRCPRAPARSRAPARDAWPPAVGPLHRGARGRRAGCSRGRAARRRCDVLHPRGAHHRPDDLPPRTLYHLALATPDASRRPLHRTQVGSVWRIDWTRSRAFLPSPPRSGRSPDRPRPRVRPRSGIVTPSRFRSRYPSPIGVDGGQSVKRHPLFPHESRRIATDRDGFKSRPWY